jgi:hypothetical protein
MLNEVYLMCSLPSLSFGQSPPIALEEFTSIAKSQLSAKSYKMLEEVSIQYMENKGKNRKLKSVTTLLDDLLQDLSEIRKARTQNRQPRPAQLPVSVLESNPLDREKQIMKWQWEKLDAIESGKTFTFDEVIVYKLKLQLLWRLHSFNTEQGGQVLASVVNPMERKGD